MEWIELVRGFLKNVFTKENTVDYVCGNGDALPLPLSAEEERKILALMKLEEEREWAKTELIQRNLRLVVYIPKKFDNTGVETTIWCR